MDWEEGHPGFRKSQSLSITAVVFLGFGFLGSVGGKMTSNSEQDAKDTAYCANAGMSQSIP